MVGYISVFLKKAGYKYFLEKNIKNPLKRFAGLKITTIFAPLLSKTVR